MAFFVKFSNDFKMFAEFFVPFDLIFQHSVLRLFNCEALYFLILPLINNSIDFNTKMTQFDKFY